MAEKEAGRFTGHRHAEYCGFSIHHAFRRLITDALRFVKTMFCGLKMSLQMVCTIAFVTGLSLPVASAARSTRKRLATGDETVTGALTGNRPSL